MSYCQICPYRRYYTAVNVQSNYVQNIVNCPRNKAFEALANKTNDEILNNFLNISQISSIETKYMEVQSFLEQRSLYFYQQYYPRKQFITIEDVIKDISTELLIELIPEGVPKNVLMGASLADTVISIFKTENKTYHSALAIIKLAKIVYKLTNKNSSDR